MNIIDGKNAVLGRLASYVAKELLKGEEIAIVNVDEVIITGNKKNIKENFEKKRGRMGSGQRGPKIHRTTEKIVKKSIRGMLPSHKTGRGREAFKRVKCYGGIPKEFEGKVMIKSGKEKTSKFVKIKEIVE